MKHNNILEPIFDHDTIGRKETDYIPDITSKILHILEKNERTGLKETSCNSTFSPSCNRVLASKITGFVLKNQEILMILPAFPGKSPNLNKVLGSHPDMGEIQSLKNLNAICEEIKQIYAPGAKILLCSDGRVFNDVIGIKDESITAYQIEIDEIIKDLGLQNLATFNLDSLWDQKDFEQLREKLITDYCKPIEEIRTQVRAGATETASFKENQIHKMFCGMKRFLYEDSLTPERTKSNSALHRESKQKAYELISRSNGWSELLKDFFPAAVRLSIHPQLCGSEKFGINLVGSNSWITPWHAVTLEKEGQYSLIKKQEAIDLNAKLILDSKGRPSHYSLGANL